MSGISFPEDAKIAEALQTQLKNDPNSATARELVRTLGGEKGSLKFLIKDVIYRQGAYEVHYDAALVMGQAGTDSLKALYAGMVPEADRTRLTPDTRETYEAWLKNQAETLQKDPARKAAGDALASTVELLNQCYQDAKPGAEIPVMQGLGALLSPARSGLYAEKLPRADITVRCLPM
ncbi:hypothetical protein [Diaphorobacter aerolatus]|nr:hypothetical protein [Diaphorobacter aerolatus]